MSRRLAAAAPSATTRLPAAPSRGALPCSLLGRVMPRTSQPALLSLASAAALLAPHRALALPTLQASEGDQSIDVDAGRTSADRNTEQMHEEAAVRAAERGGNQESVAPCRGRTVVEGVEGWMWQCMEWREVALRVPCPAGLELHMDFTTGPNRAWLPDRPRALLNTAEVAGRR